MSQTRSARSASCSTRRRQRAFLSIAGPDRPLLLCPSGCFTCLPPWRAADSRDVRRTPFRRLAGLLEVSQEADKLDEVETFVVRCDFFLSARSLTPASCRRSVVVEDDGPARVIRFETSIAPPVLPRMDSPVLADTAPVQRRAAERRGAVEERPEGPQDEPGADARRQRAAGEAGEDAHDDQGAVGGYGAAPVGGGGAAEGGDLAAGGQGEAEPGAEGALLFPSTMVPTALVLSHPDKTARAEARERG